MNIIWAIIFLAGGLLILWKSAELLVVGAVGLARQFSVSSLVIGLTVVAMGTSAPEAASSIAAVIRDSSGGGNIAIGNVFGSNIANFALVGGLIALIRPLRLQKQTLQREVPALLLVTLLLLPILNNLVLSRAEGSILLVVFAVLILVTIYLARKDALDVREELPGVKRNTKKNIVFVIVGLVGLALGADLAVRGAIFVGEQVGLSKAVIGLTIIAIGTSLPELATCLVAAIRGQHDISVGNLVGSNIFNTLLVTGAAGVVRPFTIDPGLMSVDYWIMIVVSVAFGSIAMFNRRVIGRAGGFLLLCGYIGYMVYLFFRV